MNPIEHTYSAMGTWPPEPDSLQSLTQVRSELVRMEALLGKPVIRIELGIRLYIALGKYANKVSGASENMPAITTMLGIPVRARVDLDADEWALVFR